MQQENQIKDLLPCPFCAGEADFVNFGYVQVRCNKCGAVSPSSLDRAQAANAWNSRVTDPRLAQLHTEIHYLKNQLAELESQLLIKQSIINKQVAMLGGPHPLER